MDLRVASSQVARRHAEVRFEHGALLVENVESTNGTLVNDVTARSARLRPGDVLTFAGMFDFAVVEAG